MDTLLRHSSLDDSRYDFNYEANDPRKPTSIVVTAPWLQETSLNVAIADGFIIIDDAQARSKIESGNLADLIYSDLKLHFHRDITHGADGGLPIVFADS